MITTIALDLEGTLIGDRHYRAPRPGVHDFLTACKAITDRVVMFTAVNEPVFREIALELAQADHAPDWFATIEYIFWDGQYKDLNFIQDAKLDQTVLVDDYPGYVLPGQECNWIGIRNWHPHDQVPDRDLIHAIEIIHRLIADPLPAHPSMDEPGHPWPVGLAGKRI